MISTKPYIVRAIFEWCVDQGFIPYLTVTVDANTRVPREHVKDGQITLNIGPEASHQLILGNEEITFQARFSGAAFPVVVPIDAVAAIFARENGQGMAFEVVPAQAPAEVASVSPEENPEPSEPPPPAAPEKPRSHLTRIK
ncbi:MAG: ClpXP protease specificity-enhancing factor [Rhodocyclaceae bacterium]|nr:ClpXP protease specificity-enhancing factor [Rhodocyclaceae bacterium]